ncbi:MAG: chromosomal replication initiator protein DnaA [Bacteroidales bacterium]|nr:chromosomal replication initiator protein DnaA [Bacteroidales bacterium]
MNNNGHIEAWDKCLSIFRDIVPQTHFKIWFEPIEALSLENGVLTIFVPSDYIREYIEEHYIDLVVKTLRRVIGPEARLIYKSRMVGDKSISTPHQRSSSYENPERTSAPAKPYDGNPYLIPGIKKVKIDPQLNPSYSFENFVEGSCNRVGREAGISISLNPGRTTFNPLFIYGGPGMGKTHLAQAIGIAIKERFPEKVVLYVSSSLFQTQFMQAVGSNQIPDFIRNYQALDVLIVDDVHEFADKKGTQNSFFQIFNYLHQSGKQLILTSDKPPVELAGLEQRLLSRFKWGLSTELTAPDYNTRLAILRSKCFREGVEVPEDVLSFIAHKVKSNIRELEGTLFSLIANATFAKKNMTLELAQDLIDKIVTDHPSEISVTRIQDTVCSYFRITPDEMVSKTRKREIVQARQIAMYLSRNLTKSSLASIGSAIGGKDHATVLHAYNTVCDLIDTDATFKKYVVDIEKQLLNSEL